MDFFYVGPVLLLSPKYDYHVCTRCCYTFCFVTFKKDESVFRGYLINIKPICLFFVFFSRIFRSCCCFLTHFLMWCIVCHWSFKGISSIDVHDKPLIQKSHEFQFKAINVNVIKHATAHDNNDHRRWERASKRQIRWKEKNRIKLYIHYTPTKHHRDKRFQLYTFNYLW